MKHPIFCTCAACDLEAYSALAWEFYFRWESWARTGLRLVARALGARA